MNRIDRLGFAGIAEIAFGDLEQRDGSGSVVVRAIEDRVAARRAERPERVDRVRRPRLHRRRRCAALAHRHREVRHAKRIVIHRLPRDTHVIVVRAEHHVLVAQHGIAAAHHADHVARRSHRLPATALPKVHGLEPAAVLTRRCESRAREFRGDVRRDHGVAHRAGEASAKRVVGDEIQARSKIGGTDLRSGTGRRGLGATHRWHRDENGRREPREAEKNSEHRWRKVRGGHDTGHRAFDG